jgi:hypothetical protein
LYHNNNTKKQNIMTNFLPTNDKTKNIEIAKSILINSGVNSEKIFFSNYSDTNGVSVYFKHTDMAEGSFLRISNHGISNTERMQNTICFYFDSFQMNFMTKEKSIKDNQKNNILFVEKLYNFLTK